MKRPRILVVEDSRAAREGLVQALHHVGFDAIPAANGAEAIAYLSEGGLADVILLDLMMPVMDGWTFRRAQQRDPWLADIPVITLSVLEGRPLSGLAAVASLQKPISLCEVIDTVRIVCERKSQFRQDTASPTEI